MSVVLAPEPPHWKEETLSHQQFHGCAGSGSSLLLVVNNRQMVAPEICLMVTMGFLEEKPKREIQLFHEEIWQDCVYVQ